MERYILNNKIELIERPSREDETILIVLTSEELVKTQSLSPELDANLRHMTLARDVRVCKAEDRRVCMCGTVFTPRDTKDGKHIAFSYMITKTHLLLCDDSGVVRSTVKRLSHEKEWQENGTGRFFYNFLEFLIAKDLHRLEEIEDKLGELEDKVLAGSLENFSSFLTGIRKETMRWFRYYSQLANMVCELEENESGFFSDNEQKLVHMLENRIVRLRDESQLLREYCLQVSELFQSEVDIRQNRIMKILTIVTTICLPLSLVAGWYGMNFSGMPELTWKYGYPAVFVFSLIIVVLSLWIMKKKKFW